MGRWRGSSGAPDPGVTGLGRNGRLCLAPLVIPFTKSQSGVESSGELLLGRNAGMGLYTPVLWLAALAALFAIGSVAMSAHVGPKRYNRAKLDSYECGIEPTPQPVGGGRFPVKYYITAMLFIVFDIEIIFLYPWAVYFDSMTYFGLVEMVIFIATVFVAYAYVWRRGGLEWD
jgi:NADH-quinone oxidoreductase subunit A